MAKINIKSEKTTPFGRIFHAREREEINTSLSLHKHVNEVIPRMITGTSSIGTQLYFLTTFLLSFLGNQHLFH
ncbi:MAG: hypothetical protein IKP44_03020 [Bacteroidaceae bacterium]|nr:hypothetical protein [Bacteroidaceae bacterium]